MYKLTARVLQSGELKNHDYENDNDQDSDDRSDDFVRSGNSPVQAGLFFGLLAGVFFGFSAGFFFGFLPGLLLGLPPGFLLRELGGLCQFLTGSV